MPIPNTKYNYNSELKNDLSQNYIISCDLSDSLQKIYLTNKAAYLIHPYSRCRNLTTQFNNEKIAYRYKKPAQCHSCIDISSSLNELQTQKIIQNQVRVSASLFTMNLASLNINSNNLQNNNKPWHNASDRKEAHGSSANKGIDIKHNSYARYLGKKKSQYLKTEPEKPRPPNTRWPSYWGNKTRKFGLINNLECKC